MTFIDLLYPLAFKFSVGSYEKNKGKKKTILSHEFLVKDKERIHRSLSVLGQVSQ